MGNTHTGYGDVNNTNLTIFCEQKNSAIAELSEQAKSRLFKVIKDDIFPEEKMDISKMVSDVREKRFSNGLACVLCGSMSVKQNCTYRSRQQVSQSP